VAEPQRFGIGDEVNVSFAKSIVTGFSPYRGGRSITVQTADAEITFDVDAADTSVTKTGVWHDMRRCPQCSHPLAECPHRDQYAQPGGDTDSQPEGDASA
jgi:hypothetical protein